MNEIHIVHKYWLFNNLSFYHDSLTNQNNTSMKKESYTH